MGAPCRDLGQGHPQLLQPTLDETTVYKVLHRFCSRNAEQDSRYESLQLRNLI